jgi:hypothetical protein
MTQRFLPARFFTVAYFEILKINLMTYEKTTAFIFTLDRLVLTGKI